MAKKKIIEDEIMEKGQVETFGTCGFTKECRERTKDGLCTWKAGCAYRNQPPVKDGYKLEPEKPKRKAEED